MPRPIDLISRKPGIERLSIPRLSLGRFKKLAQEHIFQIEEAKQALQPVSARFGGHGTILPLRCVEAVRLLHKLDSAMEEFCQVLNDTARLPLAILGLRYEALKVCYQITEQVDTLQELITSYRHTCTSSSSSSTRKEISRAFQDLFQLISDVSGILQAQDEAARFQETQL